MDETGLTGMNFFNSLLKPHHYENLELRQLEQLMKQVGFEKPARMIAESYLENYYYETLSSYIADDDKVVPFFVEHIDLIAEALGLSSDKSESRYRGFEPLHAIGVLQRFPQLPKQFIPRLLEFALGDGKRLRFDAQEVLRKLPISIYVRVEALQNGNRKSVLLRLNGWLVYSIRLRFLLYMNYLKREKEVVIAAILTALEQLGEDISAYLSLKACSKMLKRTKGKIASSFTWFDLQHLPQAQWQDGTAVDPKIIQWWVVLADKLKTLFQMPCYSVIWGC